MSFGHSASVTITETDLSASIPAEGGITAGIVFDAPKGSLDIQVIKNNRQFEDVYGTPTSIAHFSALAYLRGGSALLCKRVVNGALYGGVAVKTETSGSANTGIVGVADPASYNYSSNDCMLVTTQNPNAEAYAVTISYNRTLFGRGNDTVNSFTLPRMAGDYTNIIIEDSGNTVDSLSYNISGNIITFNYSVNDGHALNCIFDEFYFTAWKKLGTNNYAMVDSPYFVSRITNKKSEAGRNMYIEEVINNQSIYVRVYDNQLIDENVLPAEQLTPVDFTGGTSGNSVTFGDVIDGWDAFANKKAVPVRLLINAGYAAFDDTSVQVKMIEIAELRKDCVAVLDMPLKDNGDSMSVQQMTDYSQLTLASSSSYACIYTDYCKVYDSYADRELWVPPSGFAADVISRTITQSFPWEAPAGLLRGGINCIELKTVFSETDPDTENQLDDLQDARINPIVLFPGSGKFIWGQRTLLGGSKATSRLNVRMLMLGIESWVGAYLEGVTFETHTAKLRASVKSGIDKYLGGIKNKGGLYDYQVNCDATNNTPESIDRNELYVDILVKPARTVEYIKANFIIGSTGVSFSELLSR